MGQYLRMGQVEDVVRKYHSFNSLDREAKIAAVKDPTNNSFLFEDHFDGLANANSRWASEAPKLLGKSEEERGAIAAGYYDNVIAPLYKLQGVEPIARDLWMKEAYSGALKYDASQAYHTPLVHGLLGGVAGGIADIFHASATTVNALNLPIAVMGDSLKHGDMTPLTGVYNAYRRMQQNGIAKTITEMGEEAPVAGHISQLYKGIADYGNFWHDITPNRTLTEKATSWIVEQAAQLPLIIATDGASEMGIGALKLGGETMPIVRNLTEALASTKTGRFASKLLVQGTSGLAYGELTLPDEQKTPESLAKNALTWMAMGAGFELFGKGIGKASEFLPKGAGREEALAAEKEAELGKEGLRTASSSEKWDAHLDQMASTIAAGGVPYQRSIIDAALIHAREMEGMDEETTQAIRKMLSEEKDPAEYKTLFSSVQMIQDYLKEKGLTLKGMDLDGPEYKEMIEHFDSLIAKAADEINLRVPDIREQAAAEMTEKAMQTPEGNAEYQAIKEKLIEQYKSVPDGAKKAEELAQIEFKKRREKFIAKQAEETKQTGPYNHPTPPILPEGAEPLPANLRGSKTNYAFGAGNNFRVIFEDPRDQAAYVIGGTGKSASHQDFVDYYKKSFPQGSELDMRKHGLDIRAKIKAMAKDWKGEEGKKKILKVPSTVPKPVRLPPIETARKVTKSSFEYGKGGKPTGYSLSISFDWNVAKDNALKARGSANWKEYADSFDNDDDRAEAQDLATELQKYFNPFKDTGLKFERSGRNDHTNFLAFMYHYREQLPPPLAAKVEEVLRYSPKMAEILGKSPTPKRMAEFGQEMNNHVSFLMQSKWYQDLNQRNVFRSSTPSLQERTQWQRDVILDVHKREQKLAATLYPGKSAVMKGARERYLVTIRKLQADELHAFDHQNAYKVADAMEKKRVLTGWEY